MRVAVTGANGFVGRHLAERLVARGDDVLALVRDPARAPAGTQARRWALGEQPDLAGADAVVHLAYAPGEDLDGARAVARAGASRTVFASSMAAHEEATSAYGRHKLAAEPLFDVALRPGLVLGHGGLVGRTVATMRRLHAVPLIDGGRQPLQAVGIAELVTAFERVLDDPALTGTATVADPAATTYRDVYRAIARAAGIRVAFVPVPSRALVAGLRAARRAGLDPGVGEDSVEGLRRARHVDPRADLERLGLTLPPLEQMALSSLGRGGRPSPR